jgi:hypothetical protein
VRRHAQTHLIVWCDTKNEYLRKEPETWWGEMRCLPWRVISARIWDSLLRRRVGDMVLFGAKFFVDGERSPGWGDRRWVSLGYREGTE